MNGQNLSYSNALWHVAYVEPRAERDVADAIRDALGYPVSLPVERRWIVKRGRKVIDERPLFAGYVFAAVHPYREPWQALLDVDGVIDVLGRPALDEALRPPAHVPAAWIEAMRKAEECGVFDRTKTEPDRFKIGEVVRVSDGPFAGMSAQIDGFITKLKSATARKRVKLIMDFCRIEMDVTQLEKI